jgi:hypothetical protein
MSGEIETPAARRNARRIKLMVDVTAQVLAHDQALTLCEALRLIAATRTAVLRIDPAARPVVEAELIPHLEQIVLDRFQIPSVDAVN